MNDTADLSARLRELESQAAFQEELQARLSDVVSRQDREIAELQAQVRELARRLKEIGESLPAHTSGPADEAPPHY